MALIPAIAFSCWIFCSTVFHIEDSVIFPDIPFNVFCMLCFVPLPTRHHMWYTFSTFSGLLLIITGCVFLIWKKAIFKQWNFSFNNKNLLLVHGFENFLQTHKYRSEVLFCFLSKNKYKMLHLLHRHAHKINEIKGIIHQ